MATRATVGSDDRMFVYTADDERIAVRNGVSWTWTVRDLSGKVLRELTSLETQASPLALGSHTWTKDHVWRDGQLLASVFQGPSAITTYHYHLDHLRTPRLVTDSSGFLVGKHVYYPFGAEMDLTPRESAVELLKFTGHERDIVAADNATVDYMHARYYNANLGRFLSIDQGRVDSERPQSWNRYTYVSNNPTASSDPDGREQRLNPTTYNWKRLLDHLHKAETTLRRVGKVVDKALPVALDVLVVGEMAVKFADTGEGMQPAVEKLEADAEAVLTDDAIVVRGGLNRPENFSNGTGVMEQPDGTLSNVSVQSANGRTVQELSQPIRNG